MGSGGGEEGHKKDDRGAEKKRCQGKDRNKDARGGTNDVKGSREKKGYWGRDKEKEV